MESDVTQIMPDFSEAMDFGPIPEDVYEAEIVAVDLDQSDQGTKYMEIQFKLYGANAAAKGVDKRQIIRNFMLNGKGTGFTKNMLLPAVGIPEGAVRDTNLLIGKRVRVATVNETYDGEPRAKISKVMPLG